MLLKEKRGQLAIIVILALIIIGAIVIYFVVKGSFSLSNVPAEFSPVYQNYLSCIKDRASSALQLIGSQGGRIYLDNYIPGSDYAPFSSQLNFMGIAVPYWYYISGNGLIKEQMPLKSDLEKDINRYIEENLGDCDFEKFYAEGMGIEFGNLEVKSSLEDNKLVVDVNQKLTFSKDDNTFSNSNHKLEITSKIGKFYNIARTLYDKEKKDAFLEQYATDALYLYAPVDGAEISCSPKVWKTREVVNELKDALEVNVATLKVKGDYYSLKDKKEEYFVIDGNAGESVNFMYSKSWPTKVEVVGDGVDQDIIMAQPIGNEEGMGVLGFCYVPYHYVYDLSFPVLTQIYNEDEIFQFPVVVVVDKNMPRNATFSQISEEPEFDFCQFKNQQINVNVYDTNLNQIDANISYSCFNQKCNLGSTENGQFNGLVPGCVNGFLDVQSAGYGSKKQLFSSNEESSAEIILDKEYEVQIDLKVGGKSVDSTAVVSFVGDKVATASLPSVNKVRLSEGSYNLSVYVYGNSSIVIPATSKRECRDIAKSGIAGFFGGTEEKCYTIEIPETKIDYALIGGGKADVYLLPSDLERGILTLKVEALTPPSSLEQLQYNYEKFDSQGVEVVQ